MEVAGGVLEFHYLDYAVALKFGGLVDEIEEVRAAPADDDVYVAAFGLIG